MQELLFLAHRIPYPPNKGDKIRSYHLLKYLAGKYRVHLGAFVDDENDWKHVRMLEDLCGETHFSALNTRIARLRSTKGLLRGEPLTLPYYYQEDMQAWVNHLQQCLPVHRVLVFSSSMAQYVTGQQWAGVRRVIDVVDVDSDKWRQYARKKSWPMSAIYRREAARLQAYEQHISSEFDASVFVSKDEAALFKKLVPASADHVFHLNNGVDSDYFSPERTYANPYLPGEKVLVFTGAMDYWANVDAVVWFAQEVFPYVYKHDRNARFYIVGGRPAEAVQQLENIPGVCVIGAVIDIRPYIAQAAAAVAPLRIARGVQNKVLEAMAMAKPVLATPAAMEGIESGTEGTGIVVADDPASLAEHAIHMLPGGYNAAGRICVLKHYAWAANLASLDRLLEGDALSVTENPEQAVIAL